VNVFAKKAKYAAAPGMTVDLDPATEKKGTQVGAHWIQCAYIALHGRRRRFCSDGPLLVPGALCARFVRPGAVRLGTRDAGLGEAVSAVAFGVEPATTSPPLADALLSEGGTVLQLVNRATTAQHVTVCSGGRFADVLLPPSSIMTASWATSGN
jgi:hypothetical protein